MYYGSTAQQILTEWIHYDLSGSDTMCLDLPRSGSSTGWIRYNLSGFVAYNIYSAIGSGIVLSPD